MEKPSFPMALAVLPNYDVLYIERGGRMKLWKKSTGLNSIAGEFDVDSGREDGLLGIVLDPDFQTNSYVYVFYSPRSVSEQRVSRFTFDGETLNMDSENIILQFQLNATNACHSGGDLEFGPNGDLYITTGDNVNPFEATVSLQSMSVQVEPILTRKAPLEILMILEEKFCESAQKMMEAIPFLKEIYLPQMKRV